MPWMKAPEHVNAYGDLPVVEGYCDVPETLVLEATAAGFVNADDELNAMLAAEETQKAEAGKAALLAAQTAEKAAAEVKTKK